MTSAFKATYSDWKLIKTRGVVQVVMEVPLSEADAAYQILGGMPDFSSERWFGIAPLKNPPAEKGSSKPPAEPQVDKDKHQPAAKRRQPWETLLPQQQAAMRTHEPAFTEFLKEVYPSEWRETSDANECLKLICGVASKKDLELKQASRVIWHQLDGEFQAWERLGA